MSWFRSGLPAISISDWFTPGPPAAAEPAARLEDARDAMLEALGDARARRASLALRIASAKDAQSLWALRPELMTAACQSYGEQEARRRLDAVTASFESLLPVARLTGARGARRIAA